MLLIGGLVAAVIGALLASEFLRRDQGLTRLWPLQPRRHLLSERERVLFQRLIQSLPEHIVLSQVQLLQVLDFRRGRWNRAIFNRICQLSIDFLILNPDTSIRAAIELDDRSHARRDRPWADARKTHALKSAGVPLIRWNARDLPDAETIRAALSEAPTPRAARS
jgi:very-short-patch-repair endonuclease